MARNNLSLIMSTNPNQDPTENQEKDANQEEGEGIKLPDPDMENVTVLTENLPNNPIIPWHRYDSPWEEDADSEENHQDE